MNAGVDATRRVDNSISTQLPLRCQELRCSHVGQGRLIGDQVFSTSLRIKTTRGTYSASWFRPFTLPIWELEETHPPFIGAFAE